MKVWFIDLTVSKKPMYFETDNNNMGSIRGGFYLNKNYQLDIFGDIWFPESSIVKIEMSVVGDDE